MFAVGDRVVCVDDSPDRNGSRPVLVVKGKIYTVMCHNKHFDAIGLCVDRIHTYWANRFRKIQPCEPEFIELLKRIRPKVDA